MDDVEQLYSEFIATHSFNNYENHEEDDKEKSFIEIVSLMLQDGMLFSLPAKGTKTIERKLM